MQHKPFENEIVRYKSVKQFANLYELFLVDLWGVVHDGEELYSGVKICLEELKALGKKVAFISNSPKRTIYVKEGLENLGISNNLYDTIITSGEITYEYLKAKKQDLGQKYVLIEEQEIDLLENAGYEKVNSIDESDFIVAIGFNKPNPSLEELKTTLCKAVSKKKVLVCANPDLVIVDKKGNQSMCAGVMAQKYEKMGGKVVYFGKPYGHIYNKIFSIFPDIEKSKICAIGDNLNTDIKGGHDINIDTILVAGGIHGYDLGIKHGDMPDTKRLNSICDQYGLRPTGALPSFIY